MTTVYSASATVTEGGKKNKTNGKLRVICRYGGSIVSQRYVGGDIRIVALPSSAETSFASLVNHLAVTLGISYDFKVKYQLPDHQDLDSLISVAADEDVQIMMEEHGYVTCEPPPKTQRIRLFLFPGSKTSQGGLARCKAAADTDWLGREESKPELTHPKTETWFVDALKSAEMMLMTAGRDHSGQESMTQETSSNLGSTSSSASSSSNLPPVKRSGEGISQVKYSPVESVTREEETSPLIAFSSSAITQVSSSSHEPPTRPHVLENKLSSNMYEAELNKPVPVSGYPPFLNQAQQQHTHVVYTGQPYITGTSSPMTLPAATAYHQATHVQYQLPPQPYPIYYNPVDQYSSRHVQGLPVKHNNVLNTHQVDFPVVRTSAPEFSSHVYPPPPKPVLNTHQVDFPMVRTSSPLAPELYPPPKPVDSSVQTSNEAAVRDDHIYNIDLDDDTFCAQIYKTQPPAPRIPSQLQTVMLTEALGKLRIHNG